MAVIRVDQLEIGSVTDTELLNHGGDVLINKGVRLTEHLVNALTRRGITEVYTKQAEDEIKLILSTKIPVLEELDLEEDQEEPEELEEPPPPSKPAKSSRLEAPAKALKQFKELKNLKKGEDGLKQILQTKRVKEIENRIENVESLPDKPVGEPLAAETTEKTVEDRTEEYKTVLLSDYGKALELTASTLEQLRDGGSIDGRPTERLVEGFVDTYITDKNILLNISGTKSRTDDYLFNHCLNVCLLAINIAAAAGYSRRQIVEIGMGALLHDIGMMLIPQSIRFKEGPLSEDEHYEVRKHPVLGLHLLEKVNNIPDSVSYVAYQTHEREDGKGYPKGRFGRFLHYYARIVMVADVFEALSSPRAYRPAYLPYKAMEFLLAFVRKGTLMPPLVRSFIDYTSLFPVGSLVRLSTNQIAKVVKANGKAYTKPVVSIITDEDGSLLPDDKIKQTDLKKQRSIKVVQALGDEKKVEIMKGF